MDKKTCIIYVQIYTRPIIVYLITFNYVTIPSDGVSLILSWGWHVMCFCMKEAISSFESLFHNRGDAYPENPTLE